MLPEFFAFSVPCRVVYGVGLASRLQDELGRFGQRRALLLTDKVLSELGLPAKLEEGLSGSGVEIACIFDDIPPNSEIATVEACARVAREARCDMVIGMGGGSVMDTAKVANILLKHGGGVADHMGTRLLDEPLLPMILIPTTAGTGSEVTNVAVIADTANDVKLPFVEEPFFPDLAVLDPALTVTLPPGITAATGMDALTHAIEAYVDSEWSPATDALALHAIRLVDQHLLRAVAHPGDMEARGGMLIAAALAGMAFTHSMVGIVHGIAHALGGVYHLPHGVANSIILPFGMEHNLASRMERFADIGEALGASSVLPTAVKARQAVLRVRLMNARLAWLADAPQSLRQAGIDDGLARLDLLVERAMADGSMLYNPTPVEADAVRDILRRAHRYRMFKLPVSPRRLRRRQAAHRKKEIKNAFKDTEEFYVVLGGFFKRIEEHPDLARALVRSNLKVRFIYHHPEAVITLDASGDALKLDFGESRVQPEVVMEMEADFAHAFWHGKANLLSALTRRQVKARGEVPKTVKLLPILRPAFDLYPRYLEELGYGHIVIQ